MNAYSPDSKLMAYDAPDGIHVLELETMKSRLFVPNGPQTPGLRTPLTPGIVRRGVHPRRSPERQTLASRESTDYEVKHDLTRRTCTRVQ